MMRRFVQLPTKLKARLHCDRQPSNPKHACWSFISAGAGILAIYGMTEMVGCELLIGSFGASAVLLFGVNDSPLSQPRNLLGGHVISAAVAVLVVALCGTTPLSTALGVALAISLMHLTHTTHPPGGATALIGVQGHVGPQFVLVPVLAGAVILLIVALFTNNIVYHRQYPKHWL